MPLRWFFVLLLFAGVVGCDVAETEVPPLSAATATFQLDLSSIVSASETCRSIVSEVRLSIEGELVNSATIDLNGMALFDSVIVPVGPVLTEANVLSNTGMSIFLSEEVSVVRGDGFTVALQPEPVAPVLEVCLPEGDQRLVIKNKGNGAMDWELRPQGDVACLSDNPPCLSFTQLGGLTTDTVAVDFEVNTRTPRSFDVLVWTRQGTIGITIDPVLLKHNFWSGRLSR